VGGAAGAGTWGQVSSGTFRWIRGTSGDAVDGDRAASAKQPRHARNVRDPSRVLEQGPDRQRAPRCCSGGVSSISGASESRCSHDGSASGCRQEQHSNRHRSSRKATGLHQGGRHELLKGCTGQDLGHRFPQPFNGSDGHPADSGPCAAAAPDREDRVQSGQRQSGAAGLWIPTWPFSWSAGMATSLWLSGGCFGQRSSKSREQQRSAPLQKTAGRFQHDTIWIRPAQPDQSLSIPQAEQELGQRWRDSLLIASATPVLRPPSEH